jgi:hypothetical protein
MRDKKTPVIQQTVSKPHLYFYFINTTYSTRKKPKRQSFLKNPSARWAPPFEKGRFKNFLFCKEACLPPACR